MLLQRILLTALCLARGFLFLSTSPTDDEHFQQFIQNVETLVMNTTDRALEVTRNVYLNLNETMPPALSDAIKNVLRSYVEQVDEALIQGAEYSKKRKLFQKFRTYNHRIEQLRKKIAPQQPQYQFQLISEEFYNTGKNRTEFDNLYLDFMKKFEEESIALWRDLYKQTIEEKEELLQILDEIAGEKQLREKDKLYDEFIEMFLFKGEADRVENRELQ